MSSQGASNILATSGHIEIRSNVGVSVRPSTGSRQGDSKFDTTKNNTLRPVTVGSVDMVRPTSGVTPEKKENVKSGHVGRRRACAERTSAAWSVKSQVNCDRLKNLKTVVDKAISVSLARSACSLMHTNIVTCLSYHMTEGFVICSFSLFL